VIPATVATWTSLLFLPGCSVELLQFECGSQLSELPSRAFHSCGSLKSICVPTSVLRIDSYRFCPADLNDGSSLDAIKFESESKLREIRPGACWGCPLLKSIRLSSLLAVVNGLSFSGCGLSSIEVDRNNRHPGKVSCRSPANSDYSIFWRMRFKSSDSEPSRNPPGLFLRFLQIGHFARVSPR
jgi:hypothetical protein